MAFDPQTSRFWQEARQSGLLDEATLRACWGAIPAEKRQAEGADRRLARQSVVAGHLTLWQAQQVLAGRGRALTIGKYVVVDVIGKGGMGLVFLARDTRLRRRVAIKVLSRERMSSPRALARFEREAKVGAQLQHDNLVRIYDEGEFKDLRYLVMEYIEGRNVAQILAEVGRLPPSLAASVARQVALGLEHARLKGLIHRDVNPQNILVTLDGTAKLADLGLAIDLGDPDDVVTRDGATVGTFDYISPEQARHPRSVDCRSDVYSLGCALYHMIAGRVPFAEASLPEKLYAHQLHEAEPLSARAPGVPPGLEAVVRRMMAKSPDDRYPTPLALADALAPYTSGSQAMAAMLVARPGAAAVAPSNPPPAAAPEDGSDPNGYHLGPTAVARELPPTRTASSMGPQPGDAAVAETRPGSDPGAGAGPESDATRPTEPDAEDEAPAPAGGNGLGLPIDLGPEPSLVETLSASRSRSRSSASRTGSGTDSTDKALATVDGRPSRPPGRRRLPAIIAAIGMLAAVLLLIFAWFGRGGGDADGVAPPGGPATSDSGGADVEPTAPETPDRPPIGPSPAFTVGRGDGSRSIPCASLQDALLLAPNNGGTIFIGDEPAPIRIGAKQPALLVPQSTIVIRPAPGTRPTLTIDLEGQEPWLRQSGGALRLEGLTVVARYGGTGRGDAPRPPLIEAHGGLTLRRCTFSARSSRGQETRAVSSAGTGTTVVGCLFVGFDRPIDLVAFNGMRHEVSQCIFVWPSGAADRRPGWAVRVATETSGQAGPARLTIDHCTALRGAGLIEATSLLVDPPLQVRVAGTGVRADHLLAWSPPARDLPFPAGLRWTGEGNRYDLQGRWVVPSAEGQDAPEGAPTDRDSWVAAIGIDDAGTDDSEQALVEIPDESALESGPLSPPRFAARSDGDPIGADPSQVGPPGRPGRRAASRGAD